MHTTAAESGNFDMTISRSAGEQRLPCGEQKIVGQKGGEQWGGEETWRKVKEQACQGRRNPPIKNEKGNRQQWEAKVDTVIN